MVPKALGAGHSPDMIRCKLGHNLSSRTDDCPQKYLKTGRKFGKLPRIGTAMDDSVWFDIVAIFIFWRGSHSDFHV